MSKPKQDEEEYQKRYKIARELDDVLGESVRISFEEKSRVIAADLIGKRNMCRDPHMLGAFDLILTSYYLSKEEHAEATKRSRP